MCEYGAMYMAGGTYSSSSYRVVVSFSRFSIRERVETKLA